MYGVIRSFVVSKMELCGMGAENWESIRIMLSYKIRVIKYLRLKKH